MNEFQETLLRIVYQSEPPYLSANQIAERANADVDRVKTVLWFRLEGVRIYRRRRNSNVGFEAMDNLEDGFYFCPNKATNPTLYREYVAKFSKT